MKELIASLLLFLIFTDMVAGKDQNASLFESGNIAFHDGRFGQALTNYQAQINEGLVSAPLHFNLATAAFHDRQLGRAIFHYRQAHSLDPRDENIHHNLKIAREEVHNGSPPKPGLWQRLTGFSTLNEWTLVAAAPLTTWFIWLAAINIMPQWKRHGAIIRPLWGGAAIILTLIAIFTWHSKTSHKFGVING